MPQQKFGGKHTAEKLDKLEAYLRPYVRVFKNQSLRTIYFDAFAGTGEIPTAADQPLFSGEDYRPFITGSTERALGLKEKFSEYVFVEKSVSKARELKARLDRQHPNLADRIRVVCSDANAALDEFCNTTNWKTHRAVVFLDPFGNQVRWSTLEAIAKTKAIDLWYLFPAGLGVHRQIGTSGKVHRTHVDSLDMLLGTGDWRTAFIHDTNVQQGELFGQATSASVKVATPESITRFMIERMRMIFKGGVLDIWLPLGSRGVHMYSLVFAWANPSEKAKLAGKLARAVLRSDSRGRRK